MKANLAAKLSAPAVLLFTAAFIAGCTAMPPETPPPAPPPASSGTPTPPAKDWNSRIGACTYDQCVAELGLPDKENTLSDGKIAYQWITLRGGTRILNNGGYTGATGGMGASQPFMQTYRDHVLELTFDKNGRLVSAAKNY